MPGRSIVGVQIVAGGTVTVGKTVGSPGLRSRVGCITQDPNVYSDLTAHANLTFFAVLAGAPRADVERAGAPTRKALS